MSMLCPPSFTLLVIESPVDAQSPLHRRLGEVRSPAESVTILDAADICEGIGILAGTTVDVVLLELVGEEERSMVRRLREAAPRVPIVISTDAAHESQASDAVQAGAQDYVITDLDDVRVIWRAIHHAVERAALDQRREALLIREHDARLAAEEAREDADRARANAEAVERRASFLADASAAVTTTLDPRAILTTAVRLAVPTLASGAAAFIATDDGALSLVNATDAVSPNGVRALAVARRLVGQEPLARGLNRARRRGCVVLDGRSDSSSASSQTRELAGALPRRRHCVLIPLRARGRPLGLLLLIMGNKRPSHDPVDLPLVQAFASRVAVALDNACLFEASQRAIRTRDHVLGIVSHDLRNPLSAIGMCAAALRNAERLNADERQRLVSAIRQAVDWTQRLLGDLVDFASIEAGRLSMEAHLIDPIVLLGKTLDLFEGDPGSVVVRLAADVPESLPRIMGDEHRLLQVLGNLISNARKFTPRDGSITLGATVVAGAVRFTVADTGPGIAAEYQPHLFDWFWRASRERAERGTGLGLAIAKGIVEAHDGRIEVESIVGHGATFSFTIPLARVSSGVVSTSRAVAAAV